ncbi:YdcF family protein [Kordiimonas pumila]|uniref:YdcF family protein n=1 Tax=Kordiimonas pumila TaxID=2161677 RepID=A0ABV7D0P1_9PROT|nr:YdcF family protein [Kordiimonas pumila]
MAKKIKKPILRITSQIGLYLLIAWVLGFGFFMTQLPDIVPEDGLSADAIVVLTGGAGRLETGARLMEKRAAKRMLISGVHPDVTLNELPAISGVSPDIFACCVDLDYIADSTFNNAREAAVWARQNDYKKLVIVTSDYHMPRSMSVFRRAMPEMDMVAFPVKTKTSPLGIAKEYTKYLITLMTEIVGF